MRFQDYRTDGFYDEMFDPQLRPRPGAEAVVNRFNELPLEELKRRQQAAEKTLLQMGITFSVYGDEQGTERIFPFDIVPRIIPQNEWAQIEAGLKQRIQALNLFIDDLYHEQKILKDGIIPAELVLSASGYRPECIGLKPPGGVWCHITGTDLVRGADGKFYVLEDNLRCPSGVSYVLQNRVVMKRSFPRAFDAARVIPVSDYPNRLLEMLQHLAPPRREKPVVAVWTPGVYNSAYFEHSFLAQQMGVELVEGRDLAVVDDRVMMRTTTGLKPVDVLYRRIDDDFIDPEVFRADSMLGVPGLMRAYRAGRVALANAPGTGVADDKAVYAYVPEMIRYYLDEDAILNNVETYLCWREKDLQYVLANLDKLVVKKVGESGGYGMLVGPHATPQERAAVRRAGPGQPAQLHCPADPGALPGADPGRRSFRGAACRSAPLHPLWRGDLRHARRPDPRRPEERFAGGQFQPGGRQQGYLGGRGLLPAAEEVPHAEPRCRIDLLDGPLRRAGRERGAHHGCQLPHDPRPAPRHRRTVGAAGRHHRRRSAVQKTLRRVQPGECRSVPDLRQPQPELHPFLSESGQGECPFGARMDQFGDVAAGQHLLPAAQGRLAPGRRDRAAARVLRRDHDGQPSLHRPLRKTP